MADLKVAPVLAAIAAGAAEADATRSIRPDVIAAIKANDVMRLSASAEIGGLNGDTAQIGAELEAVAAACGSTGWCLWNHLSTFHLFCGLLGPAHATVLSAVTRAHHWVCFPAGASTAISGVVDGGSMVLSGVAAFGSGARYAEHAGVVFMPKGAAAPRFALVSLADPGVRIDPTWQAMSLRASATDHVHYDQARVPVGAIVDFPAPTRIALRDPARAVIHHRYREDWVGVSDLWLGAMAVGVAQACLDDACEGIKGRSGIMGVKLIERPNIHLNLGEAGALIAAARAVVGEGLRRTDDRIARKTTPTEADYLAQVAAGMSAVRLCDQALSLVLRVLGGAGLREGAAFERRYRDFQAMPLHINAHPDRVHEQFGRHLLGLPAENPF